MEEIDHGRLSQTCRQICVQTERLVNRALDQGELTAVQACTLRFILCRTQQGTSLTEIHKAFGCSMATLSSVVKRLREKGYVRAECCAGDDRCKLLFATEQGERIRERLDSAMQEIRTQVYACFTQAELAESEQKEVPNS